MKTPFTVEQFLDIFKKYNETVFPMQIILYLIGAVAVYFSVRPTAKSDRIISGVLAFLWLWMGAVYHLIFFTAINSAAYLFAALFILQSSLFLGIGVVQDKLSFSFRYDVYGISGIIVILFALIGYPVLGLSFGRVYPNSPTFGLPCPTTIFTFGLLLLNGKKCPVSILIIPFIWSLIGFTAAFKFGIVEDTGLLIVGLFASSILLIRNKTYKWT